MLTVSLKWNDIIYGFRRIFRPRDGWLNWTKHNQLIRTNIPSIWMSQYQRTASTNSMNLLAEIKSIYENMNKK